MLSKLISVINLFLIRQLKVSMVFMNIFDAEMRSRWSVHDIRHVAAL